MFRSMPTKSEQKTKDSQKSAEEDQARLRHTALKHAFAIEEKKRTQGRVLDLALQAFDLPSTSTADPAKPSAEDLELFADCLQLFSPNDLDELVEERNIDHRCGFALCPKPNRKNPRRGEKTWNGKLGGGFAFVDRSEKEKWCSNECHDRNSFVRRQLQTEPAWLREDQSAPIRLLDQTEDTQLQSPITHNEDRDAGTSKSKDKLQMLESERVGNGVRGSTDVISVFEREPTENPRPPQPQDMDMIEGLPSSQRQIVP